jgi:hypothetical protein
MVMYQRKFIAASIFDAVLAVSWAAPRAGPKILRRINARVAGL